MPRALLPRREVLQHRRERVVVRTLPSNLARTREPCAAHPCVLGPATAQPKGEGAEDTPHWLLVEADQMCARSKDERVLRRAQIAARDRLVKLCPNVGRIGREIRLQDNANLGRGGGDLLGPPWAREACKHFRICLRAIVHGEFLVRRGEGEGAKVDDDWRQRELEVALLSVHAWPHDPRAFERVQRPLRRLPRDAAPWVGQEQLARARAVRLPHAPHAVAVIPGAPGGLRDEFVEFGVGAAVEAVTRHVYDILLLPQAASNLNRRAALAQLRVAVLKVDAGRHPLPIAVEIRCHMPRSREDWHRRVKSLAITAHVLRREVGVHVGRKRGLLEGIVADGLGRRRRWSGRSIDWYELSIRADLGSHRRVGRRRRTPLSRRRRAAAGEQQRDGEQPLACRPHFSGKHCDTATAPPSLQR